MESKSYLPVGRRVPVSRPAPGARWQGGTFEPGIVFPTPVLVPMRRLCGLSSSSVTRHFRQNLKKENKYEY